MLNKKIGNGIAVVVLVLTVVFILAVGYLSVKDPPRVSPQETLRMMQEHYARQGGKK